MRQYIMAFDQGTTSSRAMIFNKRGEIVSRGQNEFTQIYPKPGYVEHDPLEILYSQLRAAADAFSASGLSPDDIAAIAIANQRETTVIWDRRTGRPVYNAIVWQCRRTAHICEELIGSGLAPYIVDKTGLLVDAYFSATKIKWILDNVKGARQKAQNGNLLFGTIDSWLIWNLTGGKKHVTDYSNAARTMLFDIDALTWNKQICSVLDIPMDMLPTPMPSSCILGELVELKGIEELKGIPIASAAGDQQAALFGQACFEPGMAKNTYGTGCFLMMNAGKKSLRSKNRLLSTIAWGIGDEVEYALEGSAFNAGSVIKWLRDDLRLIDSAPECDMLAASVQSSNGVFFVPAFTGLGAPHWDMYARGAIMGLTRGVNKAHICRAVLESIAYQVKDLLDAMATDSGYAIKQLKVDGGASVSDIMMQFQSNISNITVDRPLCVETTALGAAYLAGLAVGVYKSRNEISENWRSERIFTPDMEQRIREKLTSNWNKAVARASGWEDKK